MKPKIDSTCVCVCVFKPEHVCNDTDENCFISHFYMVNFISESVKREIKINKVIVLLPFNDRFTRKHAKHPLRIIKNSIFPLFLYFRFIANLNCYLLNKSADLKNIYKQLSIEYWFDFSVFFLLLLLFFFCFRQ